MVGGERLLPKGYLRLRLRFLGKVGKAIVRRMRRVEFGVDDLPIHS